MRYDSPQYPLYNALDALVMKDDKAARPVTFGEFEAARKPGAPGRGALQEAVYLYHGFSPNDRPVLARMLSCQACLAGLIMESFHKVLNQSELEQTLCAFVESDRFAQEFAWFPSSPREERNVVKAYILPRLKQRAYRV